ncbi:hypothetical protein [Streptomyces sp. NPDC003635]
MAVRTGRGCAVSFSTSSRDSAVDRAPDELTEWYLLQAWPASAQDTTVLRRRDAYGAAVRVR